VPSQGRVPATIATPPKLEKPEIVVMRVQLELKARGLYAGAIDGRLTDEVRNSIRAFQIVQRLKETGSMDNGSLAKLGIA
jgi:peptidoglycan hydrolase-like protein with peptidoglycan-binding domain